MLLVANGIGAVRELGAEVREDRVDQDAVGLATGDRPGIDIRGDGDDALAISSPDRRQRHVGFERGHAGDRNLGSARRPVQVSLDAGNRIRLVRGQSHLDLDFVPTGLEPDGLGAEESRPYLSRKLVEREPEGARP